MGDSVPSTRGQISLTDTSLEPSISRTRPTTSRGNSSNGRLFLSDAQAVCRCNCLGSKLTPFFHMCPSGSHPLGLPERVERLLQSLANSTVKQPTSEIS